MHFVLAFLLLQTKLKKTQLLYSVQHTQGHSSEAITEQSPALVSLPISHSEPWQYPGGRRCSRGFSSAKALTSVSRLALRSSAVPCFAIQYIYLFIFFKLITLPSVSFDTLKGNLYEVAVNHPPSQPPGHIRIWEVTFGNGWQMLPLACTFRIKHYLHIML